MERVKRQKPGKKDAAHPLASSTIRAGLAKIDRSTLDGLRNYALLSIAVNTGRRVSELAGLRYKHLHRDGNTCVVEFDHCKGNKHFTNRLQAKTTRALYVYLETIYPGQRGGATALHDSLVANSRIERVLSQREVKNHAQFDNSPLTSNWYWWRIVILSIILNFSIYGPRSIFEFAANTENAAEPEVV